VADFVSGYNIVEKVGDGARSQVYKVREPSGGAVFALKRVVRDRHEDTRFLEQAITEYKVASQLNHPLLRRCFDLRRIRRLFRLVEVQVVMEFVDGVSLDRRPPEGVWDIVRLFTEVADGLRHMNSCGFLHTDIKPNNILANREGDIKIIDFGQSCPIGFRKPRIQGTPDYIAPEQVERCHLTTQTDVFNWGATIYWALTQQAYPTIISKHEGRRQKHEVQHRKPPPPDQLNPEVPRALSNLVMQCCEYDRQKRPKNMGDVIDRMEMIQEIMKQGAEVPSTGDPAQTKSKNAHRDAHNGAGGAA